MCCIRCFLSIDSCFFVGNTWKNGRSFVAVTCTVVVSQRVVCWLGTSRSEAVGYYCLLLCILAVHQRPCNCCIVVHPGLELCCLQSSLASILSNTFSLSSSAWPFENTRWGKFSNYRNHFCQLALILAKKEVLSPLFPNAIFTSKFLLFLSSISFTADNARGTGF